MKWYLDVLKKYGVFSGRACRKEYWMFFLFNVIILVVLDFLDARLGLGQGMQGILSTLYQLAVLIPSIALGVRRMHDTDHSGWWFLVPIVSLVFALTEGTRGFNEYGPDPKAIPELA